MLPASLGSYGLAATACVGILGLMSTGRLSRHWPLIGFAVIALAWAAAGGWAAWSGQTTPLYPVLDLGRSLALLLLVADGLRRVAGRQAEPLWRTRPGALVLGLAALALPLAAASLILGADAVRWLLIGQVGTAVVGLFLIENLFQAGGADGRWSSKHLVIGSGAVFAFDLFFYTDALLLLRINHTIQSVQPIIAVLVLPLILVSSRRLSSIRIDLPVSRRLLVSTTALVASGLYFLAAAGIAYMIRGLGLGWEVGS